MKELSIEEKAKRYDKAIKVAQRFYNNSAAITKKGLEDVFPELKESGDEEIREMLKVAVERTPWMQDKKEKCYEWLEKQGEQKTVDELNQQEAMDIAVAKCFEWDEQKPTDKVEPKFKVGQTIKKEGFNLGFTIVKIEDGFYCNDMGDYFPFTDQDDWVLVEQKSTEWNEEDDIMVHDIDYALRCQITYPISKLQSISNWILNLKDRVQPQPKQEWSEEDDRMYNIIVSYIPQHLTAESYTACINWLKGRYTWKPSDEQMETLEYYMHTLVCNSYKETLLSLYQDLKKLRGEKL